MLTTYHIHIRGVCVCLNKYIVDIFTYIIYLHDTFAYTHRIQCHLYLRSPAHLLWHSLWIFVGYIYICDYDHIIYSCIIGVYIYIDTCRWVTTMVVNYLGFLWCTSRWISYLKSYLTPMEQWKFPTSNAWDSRSSKDGDVSVPALITGVFNSWSVCWKVSGVGASTKMVSHQWKIKVPCCS